MNKYIFNFKDGWWVLSIGAFWVGYCVGIEFYSSAIQGVIGTIGIFGILYKDKKDTKSTNQ